MLAAVARREATPGSLARQVGTYRGFEVWLKASANAGEAPTALLKLDGDGPAYEGHVGESDLGVIQSLDHQLRGIEERIASAQQARARLEQQMAAIQGELDKPWEHAARFEAARAELAALDASLRAADRAQSQAGVETGAEVCHDDPPEPLPLEPGALADLSGLYAGDPGEPLPVHMEIEVQSGGAAVTFTSDIVEATLTTNAPAVVTVKSRLTMEEMARLLGGRSGSKSRNRERSDEVVETMSLFG